MIKKEFNKDLQVISDKFLNKIQDQINQLNSLKKQNKISNNKKFVLKTKTNNVDISNKKVDFEVSFIQNNDCVIKYTQNPSILKNIKIYQGLEHFRNSVVSEESFIKICRIIEVNQTDRVSLLNIIFQKSFLKTISLKKIGLNCQSPWKIEVYISPKLSEKSSEFLVDSPSLKQAKRKIAEFILNYCFPKISEYLGKQFESLEGYKETIKEEEQFFEVKKQEMLKKSKLSMSSSSSNIRRYGLPNEMVELNIDIESEIILIYGRLSFARRVKKYKKSYEILKKVISRMEESYQLQFIDGTHQKAYIFSTRVDNLTKGLKREEIEGEGWVSLWEVRAPVPLRTEDTKKWVKRKKMVKKQLKKLLVDSVYSFVA